MPADLARLRSNARTSCAALSLEELEVLIDVLLDLLAERGVPTDQERRVLLERIQRLGRWRGRRSTVTPWD